MYLRLMISLDLNVPLINLYDKPHGLLSVSKSNDTEATTWLPNNFISNELKDNKIKFKCFGFYSKFPIDK